MSAEHSAHGTSVTSLQGPETPADGGTVRRFTRTARTATITLSSGRRVEAWTFNGQVPGPQIRATQGDLIEVTLHNADITAGVTLHWHGYDVPGGEDGVPGLTQEAVLPGQGFVHRFLASQVGSYWYHTHEVSDRGVAMGLFGSLIVTPRGAPTPGLDLTLPVHTFSGTTVLGDHDQLTQQTVAPGTSVRLRLVNTDNVPHRLALAGPPYRLVATDGADVNEPGDLTRVGLRLPAAGRYDLAFTMPANPVALRVDDGRGAGLTLTLDGFAGLAAVDNTAAWPELDLTKYGTPSATPFGLGSRFDRHFTVVLDRGLGLVSGRPMYAHTVNGYTFPSIPTQVVRENDLVRMTVVNRSSDTHPWHLHGHHVLVLARNGHALTGSPLWLDTFDVRPGEVWDVAFRATNPGLWMNHCHNLAHADQGMALHLAYEGITTPFHGPHGG
jgi:FtsP/CotA-like multicopper oxidase with cupredoxin domain